MNEAIQHISIVGLGNVGYHLAKALAERGIHISHIVTSQTEAPDFLSSTRLLHDYDLLPTDQLVLLAVPDDKIGEVLEKIPESTPVAYTSGSKKIDSLPKRKNLGVFYPLQTFSKEIDVNIFEVPFFIEGNNTEFAQQLFDLAWKISRKVSFANSEDRGKLHLAAVFVNNFTNHLNYIAKSYLDQENLDYEHLIPLLKETVNKLERNSPYDAQTGPARRNDKKVLYEHLSKLSDEKKEIYKVITNSILEAYKHEKL